MKATGKPKRYWLSPAELRLNPNHITKEDGVAYLFHHAGLPMGDDQEFPALSRIRFFEDGRLLESHKQHGHIRNMGGGSCSHWNHYLIFSTSDNSDPRTNGRAYVLKDPAAIVLDQGSGEKFEKILDNLCVGQDSSVQLSTFLESIRVDQRMPLLHCVIETLLRARQTELAVHYLYLAWTAGDHSPDLLSLFTTQTADKIKWDKISQSLIATLQVTNSVNSPSHLWYNGYHDAVTLTLFGEYRPKTKEFLTMTALFGQPAYEAIMLQSYMQQLIEVRKGNFTPSIRDLYVYAMAVLMQSSAQELEFTDFGCTLFETIDRLALCESRYQKGLVTKQILFRGIEPSTILSDTAKMLHPEYKLAIWGAVNDMPAASGKRIESSYQATSYGFKSTEELWSWMKLSNFSCSQVWFSMDKAEQSLSINGKELNLFSYPKLCGLAANDGFLLKSIESQILKNKDWSILEITLAAISQDTIHISEEDLFFKEFGLKPLSTYPPVNLDALIASARITEQYPDYALAKGISDMLDLESKRFQSGLLNHLVQLK